MKLRNKVLIGISLTWILFLILTYTGSKIFLVKTFLSLEKERINGDLERIDQALNQNANGLYTFTSDWAHWNDLNNFVLGKNPTFVPNNTNMTSMLNSTINLMTYWNKQGTLILGFTANTDTGTFIDYPKGLENYLYPKSLLLDRHNAEKDIRGYILLPSGIMMVAACAITDGDKLSTPAGAAIFGRYLSPKIVAKIEETTQLNLTLLLPDAIAKDPELNKIFHQTIQNHGHLSVPFNEKIIDGYSIISDIYGKPIGLFKTITPRLIYQAGTTAIQYYLCSFIILGVLFSCLMIWLLRKLILKRLEKLDKDVADISIKNMLSQRVSSEGNDELSSVSKQINKMLTLIEVSQEQLEQRVFERTSQLQESNVQLQQEITERKSIEKELIIHKEHLVRLAHYDSLTSLPNRIFFNEILNKTISHAERHQKLLAILFIDLDRFKTINDALGHPTGDLVLKEFAARFSSVLRAGDILARLGGDEFIILLNDIGHPKFVSAVAEKLLQITALPVTVSNHEFFMTISMGICIYPEDGISLEDLQKNADMAMYKAKRAGGGVFHYFTKEMNIAAHEHILLEASLRRAINNNEFILYYQPKLNLVDGLITGVEALIRWENPELGMVSPMKFIPLAEETGLIMQIGEWALREACRTNKAWQEAGYEPISMAVNLSTKQFRHQDIAQLVATILAETGLDPKYLELEITETAVMDNVEHGISKLNDIKKMGVQISVDDFGTGYTSISYLKQFPVSVLKIDQSFIKGIPSDPNDVAITSAVIALAHSLGLRVVAEGVETAEQLQYLANHQCDIVQGYYFSRPLPETKIILQLTKSNSSTEKSLL